MLVIFPVSHRDISQAVPLAKLIEKLGKAQGHNALVSVSSKCMATHSNEVAKFIKALEVSFDKVSFYEVEGNIEPETLAGRSILFPNIIGANAMFKSTVHYVLNNMPEDFYWFELDNCPTRVGWLQELDAEYYRAKNRKKSFLGCITNANSYTKMGDGSVVVKETVNAFMVGTAIYPANLPHFTTLWEAARLQPWDIKCREEILPHAEHTSKIFHNWGTCNYRVLDTDVVCDKSNKHTPAKLAISLEELFNYAVVHGCKDLSLQKLVLDRAQAVEDKPQTAQTISKAKKKELTH